MPLDLYTIVVTGDVSRAVSVEVEFGPMPLHEAMVLSGRIMGFAANAPGNGVDKETAERLPPIVRWVDIRTKGGRRVFTASLSHKHSVRSGSLDFWCAEEML